MMARGRIKLTGQAGTLRDQPELIERAYHLGDDVTAA